MARITKLVIDGKANQTPPPNPQGEVMSNIFVAQQMAYHKHIDAFNRTFGKSLRGYYEPYIGFDITSFDSLIQTRDGQSTREALLEQYGQSAVDMILDIISGIDADGTRRNRTPQNPPNNGTKDDDYRRTVEGVG